MVSEFFSSTLILQNAGTVLRNEVKELTIGILFSIKNQKCFIFSKYNATEERSNNQAAVIMTSVLSLKIYYLIHHNLFIFL